MRRHVPRVVCIGSDLSIAPGRRQRQNRMLWIVKGMNDMVSRSRVVRILLENIQRNGSGAHLTAETFVSWANGAEQRERIKAGGLQILAIVLVDFLHRLGIGDIAAGF